MMNNHRDRSDDDDSMSDSDSSIDDNLIVGFKKPSNRTNIDQRELLALRGEEIMDLRTLINLLSEEEEFFNILAALMVIVSFQTPCTEHSKHDFFDVVFPAVLGCSVMDMDTIIDSIIDISAIRKRDLRTIPSSVSSPRKNRTIDELGSKCYHNTRFSETELRKLKQLFFGGFPKDTFRYNKCKFSYEEVMIISLHYMAHGTPYLQMKETYGGDWSRYSYMTQWFSKFIYHKYFHLSVEDH